MSDPTSVSFINVDFGDDSDENDDDDDDYSDGSESVSDSEFLSESDISDAKSSDLAVESDSEFEDSDEDSDANDDLQIDYLCTADPPCRLAAENPITIDKLLRNPIVTGYTLCGDNIDKNVRRRYQRSDKSTISLHYFHICSEKQSEFLTFSDDSPSCSLSAKAKSKLVMPGVADDLQLKENIAILISRILVDHMEFFKFCFSDVTCGHIKHQYYKEMSSKSHVVSTQ